MKVLPVRVEPLYLDLLKDKARFEGVSVSQLVRTLIVNYLEVDNGRSVDDE